ncbi:MAG: hypothetical protein IJM90_04265 [Firmicutes bacterium]|nr:hypothetical protein [Bacillota bacterium]
MLKYEKDREKAAFKQMSFSEKLAHIWIYYKLYIIGGIIALFVLGWAVDHYIIHPPKKPSISVACLSDTGLLTYETDEMEARLGEALPDLVTDKTEPMVYCMAMVNDDAQTGYYNTQKMIALVASKSIDMIIGGKDLVMEYAESDYFLRLDTEIDPAAVEGFEILEAQITRDYDVMGRPTSMEGPYPLVIHLGECELFKTVFGTADLYAGILGNAQNVDHVTELLQYLRTHSTSAN